MWLITEAILFVGGVLAASGFIVSRKPNAKELIDKLVPYQGWIGVVMFFWGIYDILFSIRTMEWLGHFPIHWIFNLLVALTEVGVGFLLGFGMMSKWMGKSPEAVAKGQQLRAKLVGFTTPLGFAAIAFAVIYLLWGLNILPVI